MFLNKIFKIGDMERVEVNRQFNVSTTVKVPLSIHYKNVNI